MYVYMSVCVFLYMHACACVRLCIYVCPLLFITSNLFHLESNIYVGLLAYMRKHATFELDVRHKSSHRRIHTHTY